MTAAAPVDVTQVIYALGRQGLNGVSLLGTGFLVGPRQIATAYHVVAPNDQGLRVVLPRITGLLQYQDTSDLNINSVGAKIVAADPVRDLCIVEPDGFPEEVHPPYQLGTTDAVPPGAETATFGFPHANSGRLVLTLQYARVGARILIEGSSVLSKHIVLNIQAREGQSGGPIFDQSLTTVVGMLVGSYAPGGGGGISLGGVDPATLHQTTHGISAEYLKDMI